MKVIQIGANNGKDETFSFIKKNNDKSELALIIEPIPFKSIQDSLKSQYKEIDNAIIENIAISLDEKEFMTLYYLENSNYEVSSFNSNHTKTHSPDLEKFPLCEIQVPCRNINQIIDKYNIKKLDYLFIDVEGLDVHIIGAIDFNACDIDNIIFEAVHTDGPFKSDNNLREITGYLNSMGYKLEKYDDFCLIASK
jgi:FkbM family methyltransferase